MYKCDCTGISGVSVEEPVLIDVSEEGGILLVRKSFVTQVIQYGSMFQSSVDGSHSDLELSNIIARKAQAIFLAGS
jgi:hypothetical protein